MRSFLFTLLGFGAICFIIKCSATDASLDDLGVTTETNALLASVSIPPSSLPQSILNYLSSNFPNATITQAEENTDNNGNVTYEVHLGNGTELRFTPDGTLLITSIGGGSNGDPNDNNGTAISASDLPNAAIEYIIANYPGATIIFVEVETTNDGITYEVHLSSGEELHFDNLGHFLFLGSDTDNSGDGDDGGDDDDDSDDDGNDDGDDGGNGDDDGDGDGDDDDDDDGGGI